MSKVNPIHSDEIDQERTELRKKISNYQAVIGVLIICLAVFAWVNYRVDAEKGDFHRSLLECREKLDIELYGEDPVYPIN